jgi:hypothetical protein
MARGEPDPGTEIQYRCCQNTVHSCSIRWENCRPHIFSSVLQCYYSRYRFNIVHRCCNTAVVPAEDKDSNCFVSASYLGFEKINAVSKSNASWVLTPHSANPNLCPVPMVQAQSIQYCLLDNCISLGNGPVLYMTSSKVLRQRCTCTRIGRRPVVQKVYTGALQKW